MVRQTATSQIMEGRQEARVATPPERSPNSCLRQPGPHLPRTGQRDGLAYVKEPYLHSLRMPLA